MRAVSVHPDALVVTSPMWQTNATVLRAGGETMLVDSPYFPHEVRYHAEIEPTFERYLYDPLLRTVLRVANGLKVLQAGSLHAYLAYVIALVVWLMLLVWWRS